ncbi:MAG: YceI family protein [Vicingaceae bacterium]
MKKTILLLSMIVIATFGNTLLANHNHNDLKINTKVSKVNWVGKKVTGQHEGTISIKEGALNLHDGHLSSGVVVIDMTSVTCTDLKDDGYNKKLIGHLNSPDFFDVSKHSSATLEISGVKNIEGNKHMVSGKLTIKGITKPISFPATIEMKDGKLGAYAEVKIDRTLYDIKYGSGKFFEGLGDKMIDDEFIIKFKIAAE